MQILTEQLATEKQDYCIFKLTRIINFEVLTESFCKSSFPELDETLKHTYNTIVLRFPKNMSYRVYDEFDKTQVTKKGNGDLIVSAPMPEDEWLIGYLIVIWNTSRYYRACISGRHRGGTGTKNL